MTFKEELKTKIFPFLNSIQPGFKIHGNAHIARCLIYGNALCNLEDISDRVKLRVFYAIAFHDSGRVNDYGVDHNDAASIQRLRQYLEAEGKMHLFYESECMIKNKYVIVHDSDVLDIMRPGCGHGGITGFNKRHSKFIKDRVYCNSLIQECWKLIISTENCSDYESVNSLDLMSSLMECSSFVFLTGNFDGL